MKQPKPGRAGKPACQLSIPSRALAALLFVAAVCPAQTGFPWQSETLRYSINWQSGLSLGEASLSAHKAEKGWELEATVNAGVPGFSIADRVHSLTSAGLCSDELQRDFSHAGKKTSEKTTFDQKAGSAERKTLFPDGGTVPGRSTFDIPSCARDALAFLYYSRMELGQGRVTPPQKVWMGSEYTVKTDYTGAQNIVVNKKSTVTDHIVVAVKGPKSDFTFEVFYARDAARTPLQIKIPLAVGAFTLELVR
jgi:hypothetical protein